MLIPEKSLLLLTSYLELALKSTLHAVIPASVTHSLQLKITDPGISMEQSHLKHCLIAMIVKNMLRSLTATIFPY